MFHESRFHMNRRPPCEAGVCPAAGLLALVATILLLASCSDGAADRDLPRERHSVVVFLVDTLRADRLGCYGHDRVTSPTLDTLARDGIVFERCIAQSTWTKPATASVLTGVYPSVHGANHRRDVLASPVTTWAQAMRAGGYRTAGFIANGFVFAEGIGFERGFDDFVAYPGTEDASDDEEEAGHERADAPVSDALTWIEENRDEPFFVYLHVVDPHSPYVPPAPFDTAFDSGYEGQVDGNYGYDPDVPADIRELTDADWQHLRDLYDGEIAYTDTQLRRLLDGLATMGIADDVLFVFTADHGEEFHDHDGWRHPPSMYQEIVHVPFVMRAPGLPDDLRGTRYSGLCRQIDLMPTVLDAVGLEVPPEVQGVSLLEPLLGGGTNDEIVAFSEVDRNGVYRKAVVRGDYKYVRSWLPRPTEALYDLRKDPLERTNVLHEHEDVAAGLRRILDRFVESAARGYVLRVENQGDEVRTLLGMLTTRVAPLSRIEAMHLEDDQASVDAGRSDLLLHSRAIADEAGEVVHVVRFAFQVAPGDHDGLRFEPGEANESVRMEFRVDDAPVPLEHIHLGAGDDHPAELPFVLQTREGDRFLAPPLPSPAAGPDRPFGIRIWRQADPRASQLELDEEAQRNIEALGYTGD